MTTTDDLDATIRRALAELGDAAGVPPAFESLGGHPPSHRRRTGPPSRRRRTGPPSRRRRTGPLSRRPRARPLSRRPRARRWIVAGAAAALVLGVAGVAALGTGRRGDPPGSAAPTSTDATAPEPVPVVPPPPAPTPAETALRGLVEPLLPTGFGIVFSSPDPLYVVAYDGGGVRLDVTVLLDGAAAARTDLAGRLSDTPDGEAAADGTILLTPAGDVVVTTVGFGDGDAAEGADGVAAGGDGGAAGVTLADAAAINTAVARGLDPSTRDLLAGAEPAPLGVGSFPERVQGVLTFSAPGHDVTRAVSRSPGDIVRVAASTGTTVTVNALRTSTQLDPGTSAVPGGIVATRWASGWQFVVTIAGDASDAGDASGVGVDVDGLLGRLAITATEWAPVQATPACGSHVLRAGDTVAALAVRFAVDADDLAAANPDLEGRFRQGETIAVPCGAAEQQRSTDTSGLDAFEAPPGAGHGFAARSTVTVASERWVWVVSAGTDTGPGRSAIWRVDVFDRERGASVDSRQASLVVDGPAGCAGPLDVEDDPAAPLDAIPVRCTADGAVATLDLLALTLSDFSGRGG